MIIIILTLKLIWHDIKNNNIDYCFVFIIYVRELIKKIIRNIDEYRMFNWISICIHYILLKIWHNFLKNITANSNIKI